MRSIGRATSTQYGAKTTQGVPMAHSIPIAKSAMVTPKEATY